MSGCTFLFTKLFMLVGGVFMELGNTMCLLFQVECLSVGRLWVEMVCMGGLIFGVMLYLFAWLFVFISLVFNELDSVGG